MVIEPGNVQVLDIENISQASNELAPHQKGISKYTLCGIANIMIIIELRLYSLILRPRKPNGYVLDFTGGPHDMTAESFKG